MVLCTAQVLLIVPPGSAGNPHPVYVLQVGSATACAPAGRQAKISDLLIREWQAKTPAIIEVLKFN